MPIPNEHEHGSVSNAAVGVLPVRDRPVRVEAPAIPRVAVLIVTWNRKAFVSNVLRSIAGQTFPVAQFDVVVIDNASTDGTLEELVRMFAPERVVENATERAHEPNFAPPVFPALGVPNALGFGSLTIVRNAANLGGCGGFNTGFAYVASELDSPVSGVGRAAADYVWLVDDDADLPPDAARHLVGVAERDPSVGIVGSRTVDIHDRCTTIETTIYLDPATGRMNDEPVPGHRLFDSHRRWVGEVGGTRGLRRYSGVRDVDVVSACSLVARWSIARTVGFWDWRYFIYCDDADWCLRFAKAGHRVVLSLDAVVYHTPWHHKLTPTRAYYAQRNILWVIQKLMPAADLRSVTRRWMRSVLWQSLEAATNRRLFHAEIMRRSCADVIRPRPGKLDFKEPPALEIGPALDDAGLLAPGRSIAFGVNRPECTALAAEFRERVRQYLKSKGRPGDEPAWIEFIRNNLVDDLPPQPTDVRRRVVYAAHWKSRVRRQLRHLLFDPIDAMVVMDQDNDFPLLRGPIRRGSFNIHLDRRQTTKCQIEPGGLRAGLSFLGRWAATGARMLRYTSTLRPYVSPTRYG